MPNGFAEIFRKWGLRRPGNMGPRHSLLLGCGLVGQAFLSVSSRSCLSLTKVLSQLSCLFYLLIWPVLPFLAGGSNLNPCHCSRFCSTCQPASHLQPLPSCVQLRVPLPWLLSQSPALLDEQSSSSKGNPHLGSDLQGRCFLLTRQEEESPRG